MAKGQHNEIRAAFNSGNYTAYGLAQRFELSTSMIYAVLTRYMPADYECATCEHWQRGEPRVCGIARECETWATGSCGQHTSYLKQVASADEMFAEMAAISAETKR
jgi:hypothetical protein